MADINFLIGDRIGQLLGRENMSQAELARRVDSRPKTVQEWCDGIKTPAVISLIRIAEVFDVSLDWLITGKEYQPKSKPATHMVTVETVMETIRDIAHYPEAEMRVGDLMVDLEHRLMR